MTVFIESIECSLETLKYKRNFQLIIVTNRNRKSQLSIGFLDLRIVFCLRIDGIYRRSKEKTKQLS